MEIKRSYDYELIAKLNKDIHELHVNLYPEYFKEYNFEKIKAFFQGVTHNDKYIFLVLEDDGRPLGYAWIEIRNYPENAFKKAYQSVYVHQLSISDGQRNNGYGSKLMEEIARIGAINGINKIELDYWFDNEVAKGFYEKNDFVKYREFVYKEI